MTEIQRPLEERVTALKGRSVSDEEIVKLLISAGYREGEIRAALTEYVPGSGAGVITLLAPGSALSLNGPSAHAEKYKEVSDFPKLTGLSETINRTVALYKARAVVLTEIFVIPAAALAVSAILLNASASSAGAAHAFWGVLSTLAYAASLVLFLLGGLAIILALNKEGVGTEEAYWESLRGAPGYLWVVFLTLLAFLGGLILGIVPAVIFGTWFCFAAFIVADSSHGQSGVNALLRSKEYVTGYWWVILGRVLLLILAAAVINALIGGISLLFGAWVNYVVSMLLQLAIVPFGITFMYALYSSLKEAKPELIDKPVAGDRPFFIFVLIIGALAPFIVSTLIRSGL